MVLVTFWFFFADFLIALGFLALKTPAGAFAFLVLFMGDSLLAISQTLCSRCVTGSRFLSSI